MKNIGMHRPTRLRHVMMLADWEVKDTVCHKNA